MSILADAKDILQTGQTQLQSTFESKLDKFREKKCQVLSTNSRRWRWTLSLNLLASNGTWQVYSVMKRFQEVEKGVHSYCKTRSRYIVNNSNALKNTEVICISNDTNIELEHDSDILEKTKEPLNYMSVSATVAPATHLRSRVQGKRAWLK